MRKDKILNQKGLALVTVFFIFLVALIVVGAIAIISVTEIGTTRTNQEAEQAFNLAEAGIDWAKAQLAANYTYSTTGLFINTPNIGSSGTALVKVENPGGTAPSTWTVTITAKGSVSGTATAARAIQNTMQITLTTTSTSSGALSGFWKRPITANGFMELDVTDGAGNLTVNAQDVQGPALLTNSTGYSGYIHSDHLTINGGNPNVGYFGSALNEITGGTVTTAKTPTKDLVLTPTLAFSYLLAKAQAGSPTQLASPTRVSVTRGSYDPVIFPTSHGYPSPVRLSGGSWPSGGISYDNLAMGSTVNGPLYTEGLITVAGNNANQVIRGPIYVRGYMAVVGKNVTLEGPIWVNGYLQITASDTLSITGPIYVNDTMEIKNSKAIVVRGVIYAKTWIHINGWQTITSTGAGVTFASDGQIETPGGSGLQKIEITGLNGLAFLSKTNWLHITAKQFTASGLLYAGNDIEFWQTELFTLNAGMMAATGNIFIKDSDLQQVTVNWADLSSVLPVGVIGGSGSSTTTTIVTSTPISWQEVAP